MVPITDAKHDVFLSLARAAGGGLPRTRPWLDWHLRTGTHDDAHHKPDKDGPRGALRPDHHRHRFGQQHPRPRVRRPLRRHADRDLRTGHLRRHLPERRLHPDEDVRLRRRGRPDHPGELARTAIDAHIDKVRWPDIVSRVFGRIDPIAAGGEAYKRSLPNIDVYRSHTRFTGAADGRYTLRTDDGAEFSSDQVVIAAGRPRHRAAGHHRMRCAVLHQRRHHADQRVARAPGDRRRRFRGRGVRARVLRARGAGHRRGARPRHADALRRDALPPVHRSGRRQMGSAHPRQRRRVAPARR